MLKQMLVHAITFSFSVLSRGSRTQWSSSCLGLLRRNGLSAFCSPPVLSSPPPTSSETLPPEISEGSMGSAWMLHCPEVLCTLMRALLLHRSLDGSYLCFVLLFSSLGLPSVSWSKTPRLSLSLSSLSTFLKTYQPFYRRTVCRKKWRLSASAHSAGVHLRMWGWF